MTADAAARFERVLAGADRLGAREPRRTCMTFHTLSAHRRAGEDAVVTRSPTPAVQGAGEAQPAIVAAMTAHAREWFDVRHRRMLRPIDEREMAARAAARVFGRRRVETLCVRLPGRDYLAALARPHGDGEDGEACDRGEGEKE